MAFRHTRYAVYLTTGLSFLCVFYDSAHTLSRCVPCRLRDSRVTRESRVISHSLSDTYTHTIGRLRLRLRLFFARHLGSSLTRSPTRTRLGSSVGIDPTNVRAHALALSLALRATRFVRQFPISKKWFAFLFLMLLYTYAYIRPLIRKNLGSASSATINWSAVYAAWLVSSLLYHFPPLEKLGFDIKADLSIALTIFLMSCVLLGSIVSALSFFNKLPSRVGSRELLGIVVMNSMTLAMACSTYFSFCGSGVDSAVAPDEGQAFKRYVCGTLLRPLDVGAYGVYRPYVMYDETTDVISPVFTIWVTLFFLFVCNSASDMAAMRVCKNARRELMRRERLSRMSGNQSGADALEQEKSIGMQLPRSITALFESADSIKLASTPRGSDGPGTVVAGKKPKFLPMVRVESRLSSLESRVSLVLNRTELNLTCRRSSVAHSRYAPRSLSSFLGILARRPTCSTRCST